MNIFIQTAVIDKETYSTEKKEVNEENFNLKKSITVQVFLNNIPNYIALGHIGNWF